jgi:hypothetical protein
MKISVITTLKNRANLLEYGLSALMELNNSSLIDEILIGDGGSEDNLDEVLTKISNKYKVKIINYIIDRKNSKYNHVYNCPALEYNFLVKKAKNELIIKIDPEFVIITPDFINNLISEYYLNQNILYIPLPHHCYEFDFKSTNDIREKYKNFEYYTHIRKEEIEQGFSISPYYGSGFSKESFVNLGGIEMNFVEGIGSEDDHFIDQWIRKYGRSSIISTIKDEGIHLWHGEWGKNVPSELNDLVSKNRDLRHNLHNSFPNNGDFNTIIFPGIQQIIYYK